MASNLIAVFKLKWHNCNIAVNENVDKIKLRLTFSQVVFHFMPIAQSYAESSRIVALFALVLLWIWHKSLDNLKRMLMSFQPFRSRYILIQMTLQKCLITKAPCQRNENGNKKCRNIAVIIVVLMMEAKISRKNDASSRGTKDMRVSNINYEWSKYTFSTHTI